LHLIPLHLNLKTKTMMNPQPANPSNPASLCVLAIDDDEICLDIIQELLLQLQIDKVHLASNGQTGMQVLRKLPTAPDFVIVDVYMPDMDGIEFLNALAQQNFKGGVILATGSDPEMLHMARQLATGTGLDVRAALIKPLYKDDLAQAFGLL
jgi:CheY-like chemotaxis protein